MRILIGLAEPTEVNMEAKCGGAVVRIKKMHQDASFQSTSVKMTKKKRKVAKKKTNRNIEA